MGFYVTEQLPQADVSRLSRQAKQDTPLKKSRLGFFSATHSRAGFLAAQPVETHWENELTPTIIVSGMSCWLSRDPLGEAGGFNLYTCNGQNLVNWIDFLGLDSTNSCSCKDNNFTPTGKKHCDEATQYRLWNLFHKFRCIWSWKREEVCSIDDSKRWVFDKNEPVSEFVSDGSVLPQSPLEFCKSNHTCPPDN